MKHLFLLMLILPLSYHWLHGQDKAAEKHFDKALEFYESGKKDSALALFQKIVDEKLGFGSNLYGNAFFNIPTIYWQLEEYEKAKEWFQKILVSDLQDSDETGELMEPHTNYKNKSAKALAGLSQRDSNFIQALEWLNKTDTLYPYWGFEGSATSITKNAARMLDWKVDLLLKLGRKEEAIHAIISELIYSGNLDMFFSKAEARLFELISGEKEAFKDEFDQALNNIQVINTENKNIYGLFSLRGKNYVFLMSDKWPFDEKPHYRRIIMAYEKEKPDAAFLQAKIKSRKFYKSL